MLIEYSLRLKRIKRLYNISMLIVGFDSFRGYMLESYRMIAEVVVIDNEIIPPFSIFLLLRTLFKNFFTSISSPWGFCGLFVIVPLGFKQ